MLELMGMNNANADHICSLLPISNVIQGSILSHLASAKGSSRK